MSLRTSQKTIKDAKNSLGRITFVLGFFFVITAIVVVRLFYIQIIQHDYYLALAEGQRQIFEQLIPSRGQILLEVEDDEYFSLATNRKLDLVYAIPREVDNGGSIKNIDTVVDFIAPLLSVDAEELKTNLSDIEDLYVPIAKQVGPEISEKITERIMQEQELSPEERTFTGVYLQPEEWRYYPEHTLASNIVGFVGFMDDRRIGRYGLEEYFEEQLRGRSGFLETERDSRNRLIAVGDRSFQPAQDGDDLILTIDRDIQFIVERELRKAWLAYDAADATAIVIQPYTGDILALANFPNYDPNEFNKVEEAGDFRNHAVSDIYEPGSIQKPLVVAAALDAELITPDSTVLDSGSMKIDRYTISNSDGAAHGNITPTEVLEYSSNIGAAKIAQQLGGENMRKYLERFGLTAMTGITLAGEATPQVREEFGPVDLVTSAYGQGFAVTPLHMATAFSAIVNGGKLIQPRIVKAVRKEDDTVEEFQPSVIGDAISPKAARQTSAMLVSSIENGVANKAKVAGYRLGGKTGTAQITDKETGRYSNTKFNHTFVGFGPFEDPQFVMIIKFTEPKRRYAADTAAPTFSKIAEGILRQLKIKPTE
ncbi:peptidoglycan D,D-transpeptidase FtsI family protein [Patescibacteria group bacterium]